MTAPTEDPPSIRRFIEFLKKPDEITSVAVIGLFLFASFFVLYVARTFFIPIVIAMLFSFLLKPLVRILRRIGIPEAVSAALILIFLIGGTGWIGYGLREPASQWLAKAPESLNRLESHVRNWRKPMERMNKAAEQVAKMAAPNSGQSAPTVEVRKEPFMNGLFENVQNLLASAAVMFVLLYFLLASGDLFLRKMIKMLSHAENKQRAITIVREVEESISMYLSTVTLINIGLGTCVGTALYFIGMPNPVLWGVMAGLLTYIPYFGAMTGIVIVTLAASVAFDDFWKIMLPPLAYFICSAMEGNFVTPYIVGRRLTLNPVVIILWLVFWGWMWGIVGAMLAVPLLVTFKIFCDHVDPLAPVGELLAE